MTKIAAQYFIKDNQNIPFNQFLKNEREKHNCSWKKLSEICGVNGLQAYVMAQTKGEPNRPPHDKFLKIIGALGYKDSDFRVEAIVSQWRGTTKYPDIGYHESLRFFGEQLLKINEDNLKKGIKPEKLSVYTINHICGSHFHFKYAKSYADRQKLHQDLITLDPKFSIIELQHQIQHRSPISHFKLFEIEFVSNILLDYDEKHSRPSNKRLPNKTYPFVTRELNKERDKRGLPPRTTISTKELIQKLWGEPQKRLTFSRGSPASSADITDKLLVERIEEIKNKQKKTPKRALVSKVIIGKDVDNLKRDLYRKYSHIGHTNLILFLMEPENYFEYISKDIELFEIDFNESEADEKIKEYYKEKMEILKTRREELPDESEVIEFIDSWLRCDIIYTRKGGGFVIVEIKQFAQDKNAYKNGTKACQQLAAYTAVILDNILRHNTNVINVSNKNTIKEYVEGCLVAYDIDPQIKNHLNRASSKRPIIVSKQIVDDYIVKLHAKRQQNL